MRQPFRHPLFAGLLLAAAIAPAAAQAPIDWAKARQHWSFQAPKAPPAPVVRQQEWPRQPLDRFILARLEREGLKPSPEANPRALIRRVTFDLTGLPPTPEEVEAFVADCAVEVKSQKSKVKRGEGDGPSSSSSRTINHQPSTINSAYEKLVDRRLASPRFGERMTSMWLPLARYGEDQAHQVGSDTKFFYPNAYLYRQWVIDAFNRDVPYDRFVSLQLAADRMDGVEKADLAALGFLGLGPKYYNRNRIEVQAAEWEDRVDTVTRTFLGLTVACARCHDHKFDPITTQDYYALAGVFASVKMVNKTLDGTDASNIEAAKMPKDAMHVVDEDAPRDLNVFVRGNPEVKGPMVPRRFLQVLSPGEPEPFKEGSGRKELAEHIATADNPLTARVMVNRLWGLFFGKPLVASASNFGLNGERPTHPALLDDLALRFEKNGWSMKTLVREYVLSATYRQSSDCGFRIVDFGLAGKGAPAARSLQVRRSRHPVRAENPKSIDPANALLSRMNRRRLSVEQWRDSVLFLSGQLESGGGPSQELSDPANRKRTVYARISRLKLNDLLMQFDYPDANVHAEGRATTMTPTQKLFILNSPFVLEQAKALAARLTAGAAEPEAKRIQRAYLLLYSRPPTADEVRPAEAFLTRPEAEGMPRWERYAQALLAANEMLYVD